MEANLSAVSRSSIMISTHPTPTAPRFTAEHTDRTGRLAWIARLFSQPIVKEVSQASEWDNDVPPSPIRAGNIVRAERRGSPK